MGVKKMTVVGRELAEILQWSPMGLRALVFGGVAIAGARYALGRLGEGRSWNSDLPLWLGVLVTLASIGWWYWIEYNTRRPR